MVRLAVLAVLLLVAPLSWASFTDNPVVKASQAIAHKGLSTAPAPATSAGKFKPESPSSTLGPLLKELVDDEETRKGLEAASVELLKSFGQQLKEGGYGDDAAAAMGYSVAILTAVITEKELDEAAITDLVKRFQASLNVPEVREATDRQKQEVYELSLMATTLTLLAAQTGDEKSAKTIAERMLGILIGVDAKQIKVEGGKVRVTPKAKPVSPPTETAPPESDGLAPGFTFTKPQNWVERGGWMVRENVRSRYEGHREVSSALVRFLPARPAQGNMGAVLSEIWDTSLPAEAKGRRSAMVYRRFIGDGLVGQFISGVVREDGRDSDTLFTLYLIDCKTHWQPMLVAQTYDENTSDRTGIDRLAQGSFADTALMAEELIRTLQCPPAKGMPLVTREALAGDYHFGTGSTLWTENIYTGATSMAFVTYGGNLNLKPNGTFTYTRTGVAGRDGSMSASQTKAAGRWSIHGDILYMVYDSYDQGDGYKAKDRRYKIAGLTVFPSGEKVAVLLFMVDSPVNPTTVGNSGDWYSTRKK